VKINLFTKKYNRRYQEDRIVYQSNGGQLVAAVFDGHGGDMCADTAAKAIQTDAIPFWYDNQTDEEVIAGIKRTIENLNTITQRYSDCGSTLTYVYASLRKRKAYVAWLGDSPCFLWRKRRYTSTVEATTVDEIKLHTMQNEAEVERVVAAGGLLQPHYSKNHIFNKNGDGLATLRSLGDIEFGDIISKTPDVQVFDNVDRILVASDGLILNRETVADLEFDAIVDQNELSWLKKSDSDNVSIIDVKFI
jgi:serine/threonine protein phosphatase PrpC